MRTFFRNWPLKKCRCRFEIGHWVLCPPKHLMQINRTQIVSQRLRASGSAGRDVCVHRFSLGAGVIVWVRVYPSGVFVLYIMKSVWLLNVKSQTPLKSLRHSLEEWGILLSSDISKNHTDKPNGVLRIVNFHYLKGRGSFTVNLRSKDLINQISQLFCKNLGAWWKFKFVYEFQNL